MGMRAPLSKFVTNTAWTLIAVSGLGTLLSIVQILVFVVFFPSPEARQPATHGNASAEWMLAHLGWFLTILFLVNVVALAASIGFLKRQRWAYILILGFCYVGVGVSALTIVGLPFAGVAVVSWVMPMLVNGGLIYVNMWIAKRLRTPMISQEFMR